MLGRCCRLLSEEHLWPSRERYSAALSGSKPSSARKGPNTVLRKTLLQSWSSIPKYGDGPRTALTSFHLPNGRMSRPEFIALCAGHGQVGGCAGRCLMTPGDWTFSAALLQRNIPSQSRHLGAIYGSSAASGSYCPASGRVSSASDSPHVVSSCRLRL